MHRTWDFKIVKTLTWKALHDWKQQRTQDFGVATWLKKVQDLFNLGIQISARFNTLRTLRFLLESYYKTNETTKDSGLWSYQRIMCLESIARFKTQVMTLNLI